MPAPGTQTRVSVTWESEMRRIDPEMTKDVKNEPEYEFAARTFRADRAKRGAYTPTEE
jgi:hypothetical protein